MTDAPGAASVPEISAMAVASPLGALTLVAGDQGLVAILWPEDDPRRVPLGPTTDGAGHPTLIEAERQLGEYFSGRRRSFDLPLDFRGTHFQRAVWAALLDIPFGETRSYAEFAKALGRPTAARAVGAANGRNPISIVAPCHRVVGASGKLTGFAGGLTAKAFLLALERPARTGDLFADGRPAQDRAGPHSRSMRFRSSISSLSARSVLISSSILRTA